MYGGYFETKEQAEKALQKQIPKKLEQSIFDEDGGNKDE